VGTGTYQLKCKCPPCFGADGEGAILASPAAVVNDSIGTSLGMVSGSLVGVVEEDETEFITMQK
jgi:hypothetical protein